MGQMKRIVLVTAGLAVAGALTGGVVGAAMMFGWLVAAAGLDQALQDSGFVLFGGLFGAVVGGVLGPAAAWLLMRHVPLGKAVGITALGTLAGALVGLLLGNPGFSFVLAFAGFGVAAIILRLRTPRRGSELPPHRDAPALPSR